MKDPKNQKTKRAHSRLEKTIMFEKTNYVRSCVKHLKNESRGNKRNMSEKTNRVCLAIASNCFYIMETFLASNLR